MLRRTLRGEGCTKSLIEEESSRGEAKIVGRALEIGE